MYEKQIRRERDFEYVYVILYESNMLLDTRIW